MVPRLDSIKTQSDFKLMVLIRCNSIAISETVTTMLDTSSKESRFDVNLNFAINIPVKTNDQLTASI